MRQLGGSRLLFCLVPAAVAVGMALVSAGSAHATTTDNGAGVTAVRTWVKLHDSVFVSLQTDLRVVSTDDSNGSTSAVTAGCQQLSADLVAIARLPRIPDRSIERHWTLALQDFGRGARDCVQGILKADPALVSRSGPLLRSGAAQVDTTLTELKRRVG